MWIDTDYKGTTFTAAGPQSMDSLIAAIKLAESRGSRPVPGCTCYACDNRRPSRALSTAATIKPSAIPGFVYCPTCHKSVALALWWHHGCKIAGPNVDADALQRKRQRLTRERPVKRKEWTGDIPSHCNRCSAPITKGFADSPMPGRSSWGHLCGLCWSLKGREPGKYYEITRGGRWLAVAE
jgi:hypothetical protein